MICVALLMVGGLAQFLILSLALSVVLCLATGAVLCLAKVLELLHTNLFVVGFAMWRRDILPFDMTFRFLQLLLKMIFNLGSLLLQMIPDLGKVPSAGRD